MPEVLKKAKESVPISFFSNIRLEKVSPSFNINSDWFVHILSAGTAKEPKPAMDGFYEMILLSGASAQEVSYIGDDMRRGVKPTTHLKDLRIFLKLSVEAS